MDQQERVQGWIKRNDRRKVNVDAVAHLADGTIIPVRLTNISNEGCQIEAERTLPIGEKLKLELPRLGLVAAQVRWSLQGTAGIQFLLTDAGSDDQGAHPPAS